MYMLIMAKTVSSSSEKESGRLLLTIRDKRRMPCELMISVCINWLAPEIMELMILSCRDSLH